MSKYVARVSVTQELIDDWDPFVKMVRALMAREIEQILRDENQRLEDEFLNGAGDSDPVGFLRP